MTYTRTEIEKISNELVDMIDSAYEQLLHVDEMQASTKPAPDKWSKKEIIGHLIDSASNNHQRFVRAPRESVFVFPAYAQDYWIDRQSYNDWLWPDLLQLWRLYNFHIAHVCRRIPEENLNMECRIGSYEPASLGFLVDDYLAHQKHHLKAVL